MFSGFYLINFPYPFIICLIFYSCMWPTLRFAPTSTSLCFISVKRIFLMLLWRWIAWRLVWTDLFFDSKQRKRLTQRLHIFWHFIYLFFYEPVISSVFFLNVRNNTPFNFINIFHTGTEWYTPRVTVLYNSTVRSVLFCLYYSDLLTMTTFYLLMNKTSCF